jgi:hypothetical protein
MDTKEMKYVEFKWNIVVLRMFEAEFRSLSGSLKLRWTIRVSDVNLNNIFLKSITYLFC